MRALRGALAALLVMAGVSLLVTAQIGVWADREVLDSEEFASNAREALEREAVQTLLVREITAAVLSELPSPARAFESDIRAEVEGVVGSPSFAGVFEETVQTVHRAVVTGAQDRAVLDLSAAAPQIAEALGRVQPGFEQFVPTQELAALDAGDDIPDLSGVDDTVDRLLTPAIGLGTLALALAVLVSGARPRTVRRIGVGLLVLGLAQVALLFLAPELVLDRVGDPVVRDAAEAVVDVLLSGLRWQGAALAALGAALVGTGIVWSRRPRSARVSRG